MKKIIATLTGLLVAAVAMVAGPPANAQTSDPFDNPVIQGNLNIDLNADASSFSHVNPNSEFSLTTTHASGALKFLDPDLNFWYAWCDSESEIVSQIDGDVIVDCNQQNPNLLPYQSLEVTPQYRIFAPDSNGVVLGRMLYSIKNPTDSDITVAHLQTQGAWDEVSSNWPMLTSSGVEAESDALANIRWVNTFTYGEGGIDTTYTSFGFAWRSTGSEFFNDVVDTVADDTILPGSNDVIIPANGTVYVAFFSVYAYNNDAESSIETDTNSFMSIFDGNFAGSILSRGIPSGANVINWGSLTETPSSSPITANGYRADDLGSVYFAPGSSKLSKAAQDQLKAMISANPSATYKVTGYVQKSASSRNDAKLSLARARAVESYLVSLGAGVNFTVVVETGLVPAKEGSTAKARRATLFAMTPVVL